jgi:aryl-alcohol dehydrogenase-like predicted oxidoreductase
LKEKKLITDADVAGNAHCMHPAYLSDQLERSLENLQLDTLDLLYLHNASESQMPIVGVDNFTLRLIKAFEWAEQARK